MNSKKKLQIIILSIAINLFNFLPLFAQEILNIAIAEFEGRNVSAMDAITVSDFLRTDIVKLNKYTVVDRNNMEEILSEQAFQLSGCTTQECAVKMGQLLNVNKIIVGSVVKLGAKYIINANMINIETGAIEKSERVESRSIEELPRNTEYLAKILSGTAESANEMEYTTSKAIDVIKKEKLQKKNRIISKKIKKEKKPHKSALGLNYPGISLKYFPNDKICLEPKFQYSNDVYVYGIRPSFYIKNSAISLYSGIEIDYFNYEFEVSEGYGWLGEMFIGMEYYALKNVSLQFDLGPLYMQLGDKNYDVSLNDFDIGMNIGVNYYFKK